MVHDARLLEIVENTGSPVYVYDLAALRRRIRLIRSSFDIADLSLLFATMANPHPMMLGAFAKEQVGACVNSILHLEAALEAGIPAHMIQFTSSGISVDAMQKVLGAGVRLNIDSECQAAEWFRTVGAKRAGVRVNAFSLMPEGQGVAQDRLGVAAAELMAVADIANQNGGEIEGLHVYVGTNYGSASLMLPTLRAFFAVACQLPSLRYVNIGGGVGVDYARSGRHFDMKEFGREVSAEVNKLSEALGRQVALFFEPGRGLVADCGTFLTTVTDIKKLNLRRYVATDGSIAIFPRPFHHPESPHHVRRVRDTSIVDGPLEEATVVGSTTFSRDILATCNLPSDMGIGDVLAFEDAGAYCNAMASRFLGQADPSIVYLNLDE